MVPGHTAFVISSLQIARPLDQNAEDLKGARSDRDRNKRTALITSREATAVEATAFEQKDVGRGERIHASVSIGEHVLDQ